MRQFLLIPALAAALVAPALAWAVAPEQRRSTMTRDNARPAAERPALPYARGHSFATLDDYLAYLERYNGPVDLPWWREISPGVYERMVRMTGAERQRATRTELEERFGFAR